jgi:hypothetical protein
MKRAILYYIIPLIILIFALSSLVKLIQYSSNKEYIEKGIELRGKYCGFDKCKYKSNYSHVIIYCKLHKVYFKTKATNVLDVKKRILCPKCKVEYKTFINKKESKNNNKGNKKNYGRK